MTKKRGKNGKKRGEKRPQKGTKWGKISKNMTKYPPKWAENVQKSDRSGQKWQKKMGQKCPKK